MSDDEDVYTGGIPLSVEPCPKCGATSVDECKYDKGDFCRHCGASIPKREGEGTCEKCDPESFRKKH